MIDLYKIGFYACLIMLITVGALFGIIISQTHSPQTLTDTVAAIGSILGGVAGLVAATAAIIGINAWKWQLQHGKYLNLIWNAKTQLRKVELSLMNCLVLLVGQDENGNCNVNPERLAEAEATMEKDLATLKDTCAEVDTLIEKKGWLNSNTASFISGRWYEYKHDYISNHFNPTIETVDKYLKEFVDINTKNDDQLQGVIEALNSRLSKLEAQYS